MTYTDWEWRPLGELFDIGAGKTMSARARDGADKVPFLRTSNVLWDRVDLSSVDGMVIPPHELPDKLLRPGDLLVCEGGEIGRAAVWDGRIEICSFQNHLHRLRPRDSDVDPRFYVYFLQSAFTQLGIFEGAGNKTTIPNLSRNSLAALTVPHPPLPEQRRIVDALSAVRSSIEIHERSASLAAELKQAVFGVLFTHGLRREPLKASEVGTVPESWEVVALGTLGRVGNGSTPKKSVAAFWEGGTFPWLTSAKVYDRQITGADQFVTQDALTQCHLPVVGPDAVLVAITGQGKTLGHCAVLTIRATINQHLAYIQCRTEKVDPRFLRGYLETQYDYLRQVGAGGGSTKGALTCAFLRGMPVPVPDKDEQRGIVEVLDAIDRKIALHRDKRNRLDEVFTALLFNVMTGTVSADDLDTSALTHAPELGEPAT